MPQHQPRTDAYGKRRPTLTDVREAVTFDDERNQQLRMFLHALVEDTCRAVCRRGWYGEVRICCAVKDGRIQPEMSAGLERSWIYRPEGQHER